MVKPIPSDDVLSSWPQPNFENPETRDHPSFVAITTALTTITFIIVSLRAYVRFIHLKASGWDDYFIFISLMSAISLCITVNLGFNYGWDRHYWDQKPQWFEVSELIQWIVQVTFIVLMTFVKLSALCTYLRASQRTRYRRFVWATIVVVALWGIAFLFATIFECTPVYLYWTSVDGRGCTNEDARLLIATIVNIITDIVVVLMPIPIIMKLKRPLREKLTLGFLMCLGSVAIIASIVRTVVMSQSLLSLRFDMTWNAYVVWIWLIVECDLAIICISIPVLRVLVKKWFPNKSPNEKTNLQKSQATRLDSPAKPGGFSKPGADGAKSSLTSLVQEGRIVRTDGIETYSRPAENGNMADAHGGIDNEFGRGKPIANLGSRTDDLYERHMNMSGVGDGKRWGKRDPYDLDDLDRPYFSRRDPMSRV